MTKDFGGSRDVSSRMDQDTGSAREHNDEAASHPDDEGVNGGPPGSGPSVDESRKEEWEKRHWEGWLGTELGVALDEIRRSVTKLFEDYKNMPPLRGFTPHDRSHCVAVENLIHKLIPGRHYRGLREYERFLLLASAWLHDIGMIRGVMGEQDTQKSDEEIRETHHNRSESFIINHPARCGVREQDAHILGLLVRLHGMYLDEVSTDDVPDSLPADGENVRARVLAAYLCLADALHVDPTRAPSDLYAICLAYNVPISSKLHWLRSRFISGIELRAAEHQIVIQFKLPLESQEAALRKQGVNLGNFARVHDVVVEEVTRNLDAVKTELLKAGISYFLSVGKQTVRMLLDNQVLQDLKQVLNNPDFMANPSSSRLAQIIVRTIADILNLDDQGLPLDAEVSKREQSARRQLVRDALHDIDAGVLIERSCHLELRMLVEELRRKVDEAEEASLGEPDKSESAKELKPGSRDRKADPLDAYVRQQLQDQERTRRAVRFVGKRYFAHFLRQLPGSTSGGRPEARARATTRVRASFRWTSSHRAR